MAARYFTVWPHVKNLVAHHSIYGWGRRQEVWRAKVRASRAPQKGSVVAMSTLDYADAIRRFRTRPG